MRSGIVATMMLSIRFHRLHSFAVFFVLSLSILSTVTGADIPLTLVGIWDTMDACAQSCALSASSVFSSLAACPTSNPASCICNVAPAVSAVAGAAHQCASTSCSAFPSYSSDPERARAALTSYCVSNGIVSTGTTLRATVASSSSPLTSSSTSLTLPSTQFSSTTPQPSSPSPPMVTSSSSTSLLASPTTLPTLSSVQAITSSSAPPSAPSWISTKYGKGMIAAIVLGVISILGFIIFLWKIRKTLQKWIKRSKGDGKNNNDARSSLHTQLVHVTTKNGQTYDCYAKLDTGLEGGNFISITQLRKLGFDKDNLKPSKHTWNALGQHDLPTFGSIMLTWITNNKTELETVKFYVIDNTFPELLLGKDFAFDKGLIKYYPKAWPVVRNDKQMTPQERDALKESNATQAHRNIAGRRQWFVDAYGRYYYQDEHGNIIYQDQGSGPSGSNNGGQGRQGQNQGGGS